MTDIEIAENTELKKITEIAKEIDIPEDEIEVYGKYKAKISDKLYEKLKDKENGKLILVTAMSPTPLGEGKTTISIAIADGLRKIGKKSILALREPSLGPVFGIKGGATGGGHAQVAPMEDINFNAIWVAHVKMMTPPFSVVYSGNSLVKQLFYEEEFEVRNPPLYDRMNLSGTEIRRRMLEDENWQELVPQATIDVIEEINGVERLKNLAIKEISEIGD